MAYSDLNQFQEIEVGDLCSMTEAGLSPPLLNIFKSQAVHPLPTIVTISGLSQTVGQHSP